MAERKSKVESIKPRRKSPLNEIRDGNSLLISEVDPLKRKTFERMVAKHAHTCGLIPQLCTNSFSEKWIVQRHDILLIFRNVVTKGELMAILRFFPYIQQFVITTSLSAQVCNEALQSAKRDRSLTLISGTQTQAKSTGLATSLSEEKKKFVNPASLILSGPVDTGKSQRIGGLEKLAKADGLRVVEIFDIADDRHEKLVRMERLTKSRYDLVVCHGIYDLETFDILIRHLVTQGLQFIVATTLPESKIQPILLELEEFRKATVAMNVSSFNQVTEVVYCVRGCLPITYYELDNRDWINEWAAKSIPPVKPSTPNASIKADEKIYGVDKYPPSLLLLGPGGVSGKFVRETALKQVAKVRRISCLFVDLTPDDFNSITIDKHLSDLSSAIDNKYDHLPGIIHTDLLHAQDLEKFLSSFGGRGKHLLMGTSLTAETISPKLKEQLAKYNVTMIGAAMPIDCFPGALAWASKL